MTRRGLGGRKCIEAAIALVVSPVGRPRIVGPIHGCRSLMPLIAHGVYDTQLTSRPLIFVLRGR